MTCVPRMLNACKLRTCDRSPCEAYTKAPAWGSFEEDLHGRITPGTLADRAVFTILLQAGRSNAAGLLEATVRYAVVGGQAVHGGS